MLKNVKERQLFSFIIAINLILIVVHLFHTYNNVPASDFFDLEVDRSLSEFFIYIQELGIVILLYWMYQKFDNRLYLAWLLIFAYILIDDSLLLHERIGVWMVDQFGVENNFGVRGRDITEVIVQLIFGVPLISFAAYAHWTNTDNLARRISTVLFISLIILIAFAVVLDWFHVRIMILYLKPILGTIEDGGEIFIVTGILWYVFRQWRNIESGIAAN